MTDQRAEYKITIKNEGTEICIVMVRCIDSFGDSETKDGVPVDLLRASALNEFLLAKKRITADQLRKLTHHIHCHYEVGKSIITSVQKIG